MKTASENDLEHMAAALALARRGVGQAWPNPTVGCVIVKDGFVVGRGRTARGGRPHAETRAIAMAGEASRGATAYVTLEPCDHSGQTPPCSEALIAAGILKVFVALEDPDPRVSGRGIARLRRAGIDVTTGLYSDMASEINAGFFSRVVKDRPLVTLKLATSMDGRIATSGGESKWISCGQSRNQAHRLRAENDAIMVGSGTILADDPDLTCRLLGRELDSPIRIIIDSELRLPITSRVFSSARVVPVWILHRKNNFDDRTSAFRDCGAELIAVAAGSDGKIDLVAAFKLLAQRGIGRILVEGGSTLAAVLLKSGLVDALAWFHAPLILGGDALPATAPIGIKHLSDAIRYRLADVVPIGSDVFTMLSQQF